MTANPEIIAAASNMKSTITVIVTDVIGNPLANERVAFTTDLGMLSSPEAITNSNGIATVLLYPGSDTGPAQVIANWSGMLKSAQIEIVPGVLSIIADPSSVAAGSDMISEVRARVTVNGVPVSGETVAFTNENPTLGTLSPITAITGDDGYAIVYFTPGTATGTATITAEWGTVSPEQTSIEIV
jgi:hypothetical protein